MSARIEIVAKPNRMETMIHKEGGRLAGKVAIITGASKGTGAVMGKQFADAGAKVLLVARNADAVKEAAAAAGTPMRL